MERNKVSETRKIDGKRYRLSHSGPSKRKAQSRAKGYRDSGACARIIPTKGRYSVYTRRK